MLLPGKGSLKTIDHRYSEIKGNIESKSLIFQRQIWAR